MSWIDELIDERRRSDQDKLQSGFKKYAEEGIYDIARGDETLSLIWFVGFRAG
jgi:hypothetical protein